MNTAAGADGVDERMPSVPNPSAIRRVTGVLAVVTSLLLLATVGGAVSGEPPVLPPGAERAGGPTMTSTLDAGGPVPTAGGEPSVARTPVFPEPTDRTTAPSDPLTQASDNRSGDAAGETVLGPAQVERPSPDDPTPYGIETVYGSPNVVETAGGEGVDVAILDSGVDRDHPDLRGQVEVCRDYSGSGVRENRCPDLDGHGTHVAGTIAAMGGTNGSGLYGVAPGADLWAFKVCANGGSCNSDDVAEAIEDAGREGAEIIVLSIGGERTPAVRRALANAEDRGALLIAAAGNAGPALETVEHPASDPAVVAVAAVERTDTGTVRPTSYRVPDFSSRGVNDSSLKRQAGYLEVAAPGTDVVSTWTDGEYHGLSGTSVAVPHVAGVAARLWESTPDRNENGRRNDDVRRALGNRAATFDITRGTFARRGYDPAAGLGIPRIVTPQVSIAMDPPVPTVGEPVAFVGERVDTGSARVDSYRWDLDSDGTVDAIGDRIETRFDTAGRRTVTLRTIDEDGVVSETSLAVRVNAPPTADYVYAPEVPLVGEEIRFTAIGSGDTDGRIQNYVWDVDGDGGADATGPTATATFETVGPKPVTLSVFDDAGAAGTTTRDVLVNDRPVVVVPETVRTTPGEPATLRADVTDEVGTVTVTWYYPDGRTAVGSTVEASFPPGRHPVRVEVQDEYGATAEDVVTVVAVTEPTARPTPDPTPTPTPTSTSTTGNPLDGLTPRTVALAILVTVGVGLVGRWLRRGA